MATFEVKGKVVYQDLGTGFWGIVGDDGREWKPVNMPSGLQKRDLKVKVKLAEAEEGMSVFMWGTPVKILDYSKV